MKRHCPFCGHGALRTKSSGRWGYFVSCLVCHAVGPNAPTREEAESAWNMRMPSSQMSVFDELEARDG